MCKVYTFDELNIQRKFEDSIEIYNVRYKLIKVIDYKDVEICEKVLYKKGISKYYFIETNNKSVGIFVSYYEFNKVLPFLEDERVPENRIRLSDFIKEYNDYSFRYISNIDDMKSTAITNVRKSNKVLQNFQDKSKSKVIIKLIVGWFFIPLLGNIHIFIAILNKYKDYNFKDLLYLNLFATPIFLIFFLIEFLDADKKKFRIENFDDRIVINNTKNILHKDIKRVYVENYIYKWRGEKPKNAHFRIGLGLGYGSETRKVLVIEYDNGDGIKKDKFQLKYVNEQSFDEFMNLFRNQ